MTERRDFDAVGTRRPGHGCGNDLGTPAPAEARKLLAGGGLRDPRRGDRRRRRRGDRTSRASRAPPAAARSPTSRSTASSRRGPTRSTLIDRAAKASSVKAILLHIDSGGGAASGGEALYRAVRRASEKKPVVAVIDGLGASAAYMTAIAADHVVARESAITGSIGVIFQYGNVEELLQKIGVAYAEVKSAPLKGEPSLFHEPRPGRRGDAEAGDRRHLRLVRRPRRRPPQACRWRRRAALADGSIYTGRQALRAEAHRRGRRRRGGARLAGRAKRTFRRICRCANGSRTSRSSRCSRRNALAGLRAARRPRRRRGVVPAATTCS